MRIATRLAIGAPLLALGAALALAGGIGPLPDWLGWILLLPGVTFTGAALPRRVLEPLAIVLLVAGGVMNCQPHLIELFRYNTAVLVIAAALFTVASHLADDHCEATPLGARARLAASALIALGGITLVQPWWPVLALPGAIALALGVVGTVASSLMARRVEVA